MKLKELQIKIESEIEGKEQEINELRNIWLKVSKTRSEMFPIVKSDNIIWMEER